MVLPEKPNEFKKGFHVYAIFDVNVFCSQRKLSLLSFLGGVNHVMPASNKIC